MDITVSPFTTLRKLTGLSRGAFQDAAQVSKTTLIYLEAGIYEKNPPKAISPLLSLLEQAHVDWQAVLVELYGARDVDQATINWQRAVREHFASDVRKGFDEWSGHPEMHDDLSPFEDFARRCFSTLDGFCKKLKVQTGPVHIFQTRPGKDMPIAIERALLDAGLSEGEVRTVRDEQMKWAHLAPVSA
jgi:hypothetical protein